MLEPGTPTPRARLELVRSIVAAGLPCQVLVAPVLPVITDSDEQLDHLLGQIAAAGATGATVFALHLRPGAREWFWRYLSANHPQLVNAYAELYRRGSYVSRSYATDLSRRSSALLRRHGLQGRAGAMLRWPSSRAGPGPPVGTRVSRLCSDLPGRWPPGRCGRGQRSTARQLVPARRPVPSRLRGPYGTGAAARRLSLAGRRRRPPQLAEMASLPRLPASRRD